MRASDELTIAHGQGVLERCGIHHQPSGDGRLPGGCGALPGQVWCSFSMQRPRHRCERRATWSPHGDHRVESFAAAKAATKRPNTRRCSNFASPIAMFPCPSLKKAITPHTRSPFHSIFRHSVPINDSHLCTSDGVHGCVSQFCGATNTTIWHGWRQRDNCSKALIAAQDNPTNAMKDCVLDACRMRLLRFIPVLAGVLYPVECASCVKCEGKR